MTRTRTTIAILICCVSGPAFAASILDLDQKNGFRDVEFGTPVVQYVGMARINPATRDNASAPAVHYRRYTDKLEIGNATIEGLKYIAWKGVIVGVQFDADNQTDARTIRDALEHQYGPPTGKRNIGSSTVWTWKGDVARVVVAEGQYDWVSFRIGNNKLERQLSDARRAHRKELKKRQELREAEAAANAGDDL
jgi:hypothetical protein